MTDELYKTLRLNSIFQDVVPHEYFSKLSTNPCMKIAQSACVWSFFPRDKAIRL
jgi:hypothetical protein